MNIWFPSARTFVLAASAVAVPHTGDTVETVLATVTVAGGAMGATGRLRVRSLWSCTGTNSKVVRARLGGISGTVVFSSTQTANLSAEDNGRLIINRTASSQICRPSVNASGGPSSAAITTAAIDTSASFDIVFTGQLTNTGESVTLEDYMIELITIP